MATSAQATADAPRTPSTDAAFIQQIKPVGLAIEGFNYTDLAIDIFSISGQGGDSIVVSSPTSGGSGTVCCVRWYPRRILPIPMTVEWMRNINHKQRWCTKTIMFNGPVPPHPTDISAHFMPNGDVQLMISEGYPELKLALNRFSPEFRHETGNSVHDEETATCRNGR